MKLIACLIVALGLLAGCKAPDPNPLAPDNMSQSSQAAPDITPVPAAPLVNMGMQAGQELDRFADAQDLIAQASNTKSQAGDTGPLKITVHKSESCGCCQAWIKHLEDNGFFVEVDNNPDVNAVKNSLGVPQDKRSCHTGEIDGMFVEGHVPAEDIRRMVKQSHEGQSVKGIAVPGMPVGSPGMEMGEQRDHYDVYAIDANGNARVFATHN